MEPTKVLFIGYPKCSTCRKCYKALQDLGIDADYRNIKEENPTADEIRHWISQGVDINQLFNTSGQLYRANNVKEKRKTYTEDQLIELLRYERDHGKIVWVAGPALSFDAGARDAFGKLVEAGYVHCLMAGNALATHDLEGAWLHTALGQDISTLENMPGGHHNHLDTINRVRQCGSIPAFIEQEKLEGGIICSCVKKGVPFVLCGSIRDDGPLPEVIGNVYEAQDAMRAQVRSATTVICLATMLHSIAVGNMTPSFRVLPDGTVRQVYFYCVDVAEFTVNKLSDRGSLAAKGIVTNVQDFVTGVARNLGL